MRFTALKQKEADSLRREHPESRCARLSIGATITHFRVSVEFGRIRASAPFGLCAAVCETG